MKQTCRHSDLLHPFLDGELKDEQKRFVETHVKDCRVCADELRSLHRLRDLLRDVGEAEVSPDFDVAFWKKVRALEENRLANRARRWMGAWTWRYALVPVCAVAVLVAGLTLVKKTGTAPFTDMGMVEQMELFSDYDIVDNLDLLEQVATEFGEGEL